MTRVRALRLADAAAPDRALLYRTLGLVIGYQAVAVILPSALHVLIYLLLSIYALRGSKETIQAFTLLMLTIIGHDGLVPSNAGLFRWPVLFCGFFRLLWDATQTSGLKSPVVLGFATTAALLLPINFVASALPMISVLKVVAFSVGGLTIFGCFERTAHLRAYWQVWFLAIAAFIVVGSLLLLPTGLGYTRTANGYQGVLRHPQMLGPVAAVCAAWFSGLLASGRGNPRYLFPLSLAAWVLVLLSAARTGLLAGIAGFGIALVFGSLLRKQRLISPTYLVSPVSVTVLLFAAALLLANAERAGAFAVDFVRKGQEAESAEELFAQARGDRASLSMENFASRPFVGVGFGTPSNLGSFIDQKAESVGGIVVSASSEKGFMPTAVLEETGLIGAVLTLFLLGAVFLPVHRLAPFEIIWMAWAALLMNVGAAVLFSFGGLGFFLWMMLGFCYNQSGVSARRLHPVPSR